MEKQNDIEKLFKEKLEKFEVDPGKNTWSNVKAGLGAATTGAIASQAASTTSWTASIVAGTIITVTAIGGYLFFDKQGAKQKNKAQQVEQSTEATQSAIEEEETSNETNTITFEEAKAKAKNNASAEEETFTSPSTVKENNNEDINFSTTSGSVNNDIEFNVSEKTIEEIIADSQAQFEANISEAQQIEAAKNAALSQQKQHNSTSKQEVSTSPTPPSIDRTPAKAEAEDDFTQSIEFPNAFTPNSDGINDIFSLEERYHDKIDNIAVYIYSSSKTIIYEWKGLSEGWDGTLANGNLAPEGIYFFNAILTKDNVNHRLKGTISLKR